MYKLTELVAYLACHLDLFEPSPVCTPDTRACSHRQFFFHVRVDVLHYIPMIQSVSVKKILGAFKNTAASRCFSLLWVVFKLGKLQLATKKHPT